MKIGYIGKNELNSATRKGKFVVSRAKTKAKSIEVYIDDRKHITEDEISYLAKVTGLDTVLKMSDLGMLISFCENVIRLDRGANV
jgi:hypothetical protein